MSRTPHVAVLLAGCGHLDGAEIREAVLTLLALDEQGATFQCIAPNANQHHVVNHVTGQPVPEASRNMLEEASRIARVGQCLDLAKADPTAFDALVMPGGFGVAKNHCDFAFKGAEAQPRPDVATFIQAFLDAQKPIGAICIAPALLALVLAARKQEVCLTLGSGDGVEAAMTQLGQQHQAVPSAREVVVDASAKIVTAAAYMFDDARLADLKVGIDRTVREVLRLI